MPSLLRRWNLRLKLFLLNRSSILYPILLYLISVSLDLFTLPRYQQWNCHTIRHSMPIMILTIHLNVYISHHCAVSPIRRVILQASKLFPTPHRILKHTSVSLYRKRTLQWHSSNPCRLRHDIFATHNSFNSFYLFLPPRSLFTLWAAVTTRLVESVRR